jgi:hypothetical protein
MNFIVFLGMCYPKTALYAPNNRLCKFPQNPSPNLGAPQAPGVFFLCCFTITALWTVLSTSAGRKFSHVKMSYPIMVGNAPPSILKLQPLLHCRNAECGRYDPSAGMRSAIIDINSSKFRSHDESPVLTTIRADAQHQMPKRGIYTHRTPPLFPSSRLSLDDSSNLLP